jgi:hypothetical protein
MSGGGRPFRRLDGDEPNAPVHWETGTLGRAARPSTRSVGRTQSAPIDRADSCFVLAEQPSEEAGLPQLVLVQGRRLSLTLETVPFAHCGSCVPTPLYDTSVAVPFISDARDDARARWT